MGVHAYREGERAARLLSVFPGDFDGDVSAAVALGRSRRFVGAAAAGPRGLGSGQGRSLCTRSPSAAKGQRAHQARATTTVKEGRSAHQSCHTRAAPTFISLWRGGSVARRATTATTTRGGPCRTPGKCLHRSSRSSGAIILAGTRPSNIDQCSTWRKFSERKIHDGAELTLS